MSIFVSIKVGLFKVINPNGVSIGYTTGSNGVSIGYTIRPEVLCLSMWSPPHGP